MFILGLQGSDCCYCWGDKPCTISVNDKYKILHEIPKFKSVNK